MKLKRLTFAVVMFVIIAVVFAFGGGTRIALWNPDSPIVIKLTDTIAGIDTGRIMGFDSTTAARTLVRVKSGVGDTSRREWILFKPNLLIDLDSTGKTRVTFTIDSLSGQYPDSGFRFTYVKASYAQTRQAGFVNWKYTIYSDSTSYRYNHYGTGSATAVNGGNVTDTVWTGEAIYVEPALWYQWHPKVWKVHQNGVNGRDSIYISMALQTRMSAHDYAGWVTLATVTAADSTLDTGKWVSMPRLADADTAHAKFGHIGDYLRTVVTVTDSGSMPIIYGRITQVNVFSDLIRIQ